MRKNKGFTLVELLVVMAIISILAAIAIPNVQRYIEKGRATRAMSEINGIELALTKVLSDAGRSSLKDLIDPAVFDDALIAHNASLPDPPVMESWSADDFDYAVEMYTDVAYSLLRKGRGALGAPDVTIAGNSLIREDVVRNLGTSYMADLATDPWGKLYQFYPGPWSPRYGLNVFRVYLPKAAGGPDLPGDKADPNTGDALSLVDGANGVTLIDPETGDPLELIGIPAKDQQDTYIWSLGGNLESGQARYRNPSLGYTAANVLTNYGSGQEPELMGGGDDINNWDNGQTFMRFYN